MGKNKSSYDSYNRNRNSKHYIIPNVEFKDLDKQ